jgi:nucleotide-binding universal stress UspA family protein
MQNPMSTPSVVVAIDGSKAAIGAAEWAAKEALHRALPLRLVHVIHTADQTIGAGGVPSIENEYADDCLRAACAAVRATGVYVELDTAVLRGEVGSALIDESKGAVLICLGSTGIGRVAAALLGSTAASVAEQAHCPVAIIRRNHDRALPEAGFIAVILDGRHGGETTMRWAMEEAHLRKAPVLALGISPWPPFDIDYDRFNQQLDHWLQRYPDVKVEIATTRMSATRYLEGFIGAIQLVVIGSEDANHVMELVGPRSMPILAHADCSVLIARGEEHITDPLTHYRSSPITETIAP